VLEQPFVKRRDIFVNFRVMQIWFGVDGMLIAQLDFIEDPEASADG
jgi:hypothetical protein